jgi:lipopolysaccharide export system permease protein
MMFMLPLLAVSLAVPPKRSSSGLGIFVAILIVVAYHKVNQYGQQMGVNGQMNPILSLGVPLVLFAAVIAWMYHVLAHRPGGQPIGALERFFGRVANAARSMMPRRQEAASEA